MLLKTVELHSQKPCGYSIFILLLGKAWVNRAPTTGELVFPELSPFHWASGKDALNNGGLFVRFFLLFFSLTFQTLPCLVRMCSKERLLEERVEGAETLAYLIETDVELQRIASITDHLIVMLADYFKYPSSVSAITDIKRVRFLTQCWSFEKCAKTIINGLRVFYYSI